MYTLKSIAQRGTILSVAASLFVAAVMPAASVFAQQFALNPLTERSLLLSSSAPGYVDTDGSGYSTGNPNPAGDGVLGAPGTNVPNTYAPAGSGPNGKKSGQTFSFRVSSGTDIKGLSFQYCTTAAGNCQAPGDNGGDHRDGVAASAYPSGNTYVDGVLTNNAAGRETNDQAHSNNRSDLDFVNTFAPAGTSATPAGGQFQIYAGTTATNLAPVNTTGWLFEKRNLENLEHSGPMTGKNNYVTLSNATGVTGLQAGDYVKVVFQADENTFITNPGSGHFFVKINTYSVDGLDNMKGAHNEADPANHNVIDGGVTVANVMTDSIHITTKVLETMAFSVGIQNPDTIQKAQASDHGTCEVISQTSADGKLTNNRLNLGNPDAEYSLETTKAWDVYSYWRLSSNSSGGATVYYSGNTLANTVGDQIKAMDGASNTVPGSATNSLPGTEQFGLGFVDVSSGDHADTFSTTFQAAVTAGTHKTPTSYPFITVAGQEATAPFNTLSVAQSVSDEYKQASGTLQNGSGAGTAKFKFLPTSLTTPEPIAQENETVISCATAKMRYVGNIGADTPAGVYTTRVNYLAAPQY